MSTFTKEELIVQIKKIAKQLELDVKESDLLSMSEQDLKKFLSKLQRQKALRSLSDKDLQDMAARRQDGTLGQQRNKGAIAELLRRGRLGSF